MTPRIPFHNSLFWHAMVGLLGRQPDAAHHFGYSGYYEYRYQPKDDIESDPSSSESLHAKAAALAEWLDHFDLKFSGTTCRYGVHDLAGIESKEPFLLIRIQQPDQKQ